ncbi:hypothetical protein BGW37DRAFT_472547 [Umbelopsis sp. PMI_123]|nr:hypothetical protein BGW37DRAFT_472547 [Umbelopsis sp. PMI_123]
MSAFQIDAPIHLRTLSSKALSAVAELRCVQAVIELVEAGQAKKFAWRMWEAEMLVDKDHCDWPRATEFAVRSMVAAMLVHTVGTVHHWIEAMQGNSCFLEIVPMAILLLSKQPTAISNKWIESLLPITETSSTTCNVHKLYDRFCVHSNRSSTINRLVDVLNVMNRILPVRVTERRLAPTVIAQNDNIDLIHTQYTSGSAIGVHNASILQALFKCQSVHRISVDTFEDERFKANFKTTWIMNCRLRNLPTTDIDDALSHVLSDRTLPAFVYVANDKVTPRTCVRNYDAAFRHYTMLGGTGIITQCDYCSTYFTDGPTHVPVDTRICVSAGIAAILTYDPEQASIWDGQNLCFTGRKWSGNLKHPNTFKLSCLELAGYSVISEERLIICPLYDCLGNNHSYSVDNYAVADPTLHRIVTLPYPQQLFSWALVRYGCSEVHDWVIG